MRVQMVLMEQSTQSTSGKQNIKRYRESD
jgi:hypothetical protein